MERSSVSGQKCETSDLAAQRATDEESSRDSSFEATSGRLRKLAAGWVGESSECVWMKCMMECTHRVVGVSANTTSERGALFSFKVDGCDESNISVSVLALVPEVFAVTGCTKTVPRNSQSLLEFLTG